MLRTFFRWTLAILAFLGISIVASAILQANVQELAKAKGWDQYLVQNWKPAMNALADLVVLGQQPWLIFSSGFFVGGAICVWVDYFLRKREPRTSKRETVTREEVRDLARECRQVSRDILKEHTRAMQSNAEISSHANFRDQADLGFSQWLRRNATASALANEFGSKALAAIYRLEAIGIPRPDFVRQEPVPIFHKPLEQVIEFYLHPVAIFLGAAGEMLENAGLEATRQMASRWAVSGESDHEFLPLIEVAEAALKVASEPNAAAMVGDKSRASVLKLYGAMARYHTQVYGKVPPSIGWEPIPEDEWPSLRIDLKDRVFEAPYNDGKKRWVDLRIRTSEFEATVGAVAKAARKVR